MNRRQLLTGAATAITAICVGCTSVPRDGREGVVLTHVELGNATGERQQFDVLVTHDGEIIHWALHEVEPGGDDREAGGTVVEIDSPDDPGDVEVHVRVEDQWASTDFESEEYDGERVLAVVTYGMVDDDLLRITRHRSDRPTSGQ